MLCKPNDDFTYSEWPKVNNQDGATV